MSSIEERAVRGVHRCGAEGPIDRPILKASTEVDVTLLDWALGLSPRERLRAATRAANALAKFAHAPSPSR